MGSQPINTIHLLPILLSTKKIKTKKSEKKLTQNKVDNISSEA